MVMDTTVTDRRRNRSWPEPLKLEIVAASLEPGASVSVVARRHDVNANQVFTWRRRYDVGLAEGEAAMVPVAVLSSRASSLATDCDRRPAGGAIEIELLSGVRVRISGTVDGAALRQVLEQLE
jgi:transposase-like protein